jgi:hypothetical protein
MPKQKRPFQVEIEAKVTVLAFDEASARKKVERALAAGRKVGTDVEATGVVWTYATTPEPAGDAEAPDQRGAPRRRTGSKRAVTSATASKVGLA